MDKVFEFIDNFYPTSSKENFEFHFSGNLFRKNEAENSKKVKDTIIVKNHNDVLAMFYYPSNEYDINAEYIERVAIIEDKTHIKLICDATSQCFEQDPEVFVFAIRKLFRDKLINLLNEFTYMDSPSLYPLLKGSDRSELIQFIDLAINEYSKLKASVAPIEDNEDYELLGRETGLWRELVEEPDLHFLMDIKEILIKHPDFLSNVKEVIPLNETGFNDIIINASNCVVANKTIYGLRVTETRKPIGSIKTFITELNSLFNYLPSSTFLNLFRKNEYDYAINSIELELIEINVGGILTKHNKLYAYNNGIKNYILDDSFSDLTPHFNGNSNIEFRDADFIRYNGVLSENYIYFENRALAERFFSKIKTIDDARKRKALMEMIAELNNDMSSGVINDIIRKITFGQEMLKEIHDTLNLEFEKLQNTEVI